MMARLAGLLYFAGLPTAGFAYGFVAFLPKDDPAALVAALEAGRQTLRWTLLIGVPAFSLLYLIEVLLFRELLKQGCKLSADLMVLLVAASVPLALAALAARLDLIALLDAPGAALADAVTPLLTREAGLFQIASIFWGLWLMPLAWLSWRMGLVPMAVAVLLALAGGLYVWTFVAAMTGAGAGVSAALSPVDAVLMGLTMAGELGFSIWLMIFGARGMKPEPAHA
jgi:hypothetical protein